MSSRLASSMRQLVISHRSASVGERREKPSQVIGSRLVEPAVMKPLHDPIPVKHDQVPIVFAFASLGR
jgi:hypothetical protein